MAHHAGGRTAPYLCRVYTGVCFLSQSSTQQQEGLPACWNDCHLRKWDNTRNFILRPFSGRASFGNKRLHTLAKIVDAVTEPNQILIGWEIMADQPAQAFLADALVRGASKAFTQLVQIHTDLARFDQLQQKTAG